MHTIIKIHFRFIAYIILVLNLNLQAKDTNMYHQDKNIALEKMRNGQLDSLFKLSVMEFHIYCLNNNPIEGIDFINTLLSSPNAHTNESIISLLYFNSAQLYLSLDQYDLAMKYLLISANDLKKQDSGTAYNWVMLEIGNLFYKVHNYNKALEYYKLTSDDALRKKEYNKVVAKENYTLLSVLMENMALCSASQLDYDKAIEYQLKGLGYRKLIDYKMGIKFNYYNMAEYFLDKSSFDSTLHYLNLSMNVQIPSNDLKSNKIEADKTHAKSLTLLSRLYFVRKQYDSASFYLDKAVEFTLSLSNISLKISAINHIAKTCQLLGEYNNAIKVALIAQKLIQKNNTIKGLEENTLILADSYYNMSNFEESARYLRAHDEYRIKSNLNSISNAIELEIAANELSNTIDNVNKATLEKDKRLSNFANLSIFLIIIISLVVIILFILIHENSLRTKLIEDLNYQTRI